MATEEDRRMPPNSYDQILAEAKRLPREDQERLVAELTNSAAPQNGLSTVDNGRIETLYDVMEASGLVGFMTDGPTDLSTNPKHMEGFGRDVG